MRSLSMADETSLSSVIAERLPTLDSILASNDVALTERPFLATVDFARAFVLEIKDGDKQWTPDLESPQFVTDQWFRALDQEIESWYRQRYGAAFEKSPPRTGSGLVLIWGTPFGLKVPVTVVRPGTPGRTVWVSFPDSVLDTEDPASWVVSPPNLGAMSDSDLEKFTAECKEISSLLRSIMAKLMGIQLSNPVVQGFLNGVRFHVEVAAEHIIRERHEGVAPRAYWEIQMACECAYKALLQQKSGSFIQTHDLFLLHDKAEPYGLAIKRDILKKLPRWKDMIELRYGQTVDPAITGFYEAYRIMLRVVDAVLAPIVTLGLGKASLEIAKAPWLPEDETDPEAVKSSTDES
jgi:HEPN domain-containing protein